MEEWVQWWEGGELICGDDVHFLDTVFHWNEVCMNVEDVSCGSMHGSCDDNSCLSLDCGEVFDQSGHILFLCLSIVVVVGAAKALVLYSMHGMAIAS